MRIGFIGAGNIGSTLARLAVAAGHEVVLSNRRGPKSLAGLVADLGDRASAGVPADAAEADIVVVAVPLHAYPAVPSISGRPVIDTMNHYPDRDGDLPGLADRSRTTSQVLADRLPDASVVKACNNVFATHLGELARPRGAADRSALPIAGDDEAAKRSVAALLDDLGYDTVDVGGLADSWRFERGTPAYCLPYVADRSVLARRRPGGDPGPGRAVSADELRSELARA